MFIPANSGHQKHTINNFILGELRRYVRFNTIKRNFTKIKCKLFSRLRNRGYNKKFLTTLFRKIEFGSRNKLLAISEDVIDHLEIDSNRSDTVLINDAECTFQDIFSEVILPRENTQQQICANSINLPLVSVSIPKVCAILSSLSLRKNKWKNKKVYVFLCFLSSISGRRFF